MESKEDAPATVSAFGALGALQKERSATSSDGSANAATHRTPPLAAKKNRQPPPGLVAGSSDASAGLLRSWSNIGESAAGADEVRSRDGRRSSLKGSASGSFRSDVSFGRDEVRVLSPSGRVVPTDVKKLQEGILAGLQECNASLLRSFQYLNRAGRQRGQAKVEAVVNELGALLHVDQPAESSADASVTVDTVRAFVLKYDRDKDGAISFGEFVEMCGGASTRGALRSAVGAHAQELVAEVAEALAGKFQTAKQVFTVIDGDRSNTISCEELVRGCEKAGLTLLEDEAVALFAALDVDGSGSITFDEVVKLMAQGNAEFEANRALASGEAQRAKQVAALCRALQEALANPAAVERVIQAAQTAAAKPDLKIDADSIMQLLPPPGVVAGVDDVAQEDALRTALMGPGALSRELASGIIGLAPKRVLVRGRITSASSEGGKQTLTLDDEAPAEQDKFVGHPITLLQGVREVERVIVGYSARREVQLDSALPWVPTVAAAYQVRHPHEVLLVEMLLKTQSVLEVRKVLAARESERGEAASKSAAVAEADLAQVVRGLRKVKAESIKAAWDVFNPQRKPSIALTELAAGIERLGLLLHLPTAYVSRHLVEEATVASPSKKSSKYDAGADKAAAVYNEIFERRSSVTNIAPTASYLRTLSSFRELSSPGPSRTGSAGGRAGRTGSAGSVGSSGSGAAVPSHMGNVLGCMCEHQWICQQCGAWNASGGGHDAGASNRSQDLKEMEQRAKGDKRVTKADKADLPCITLVCTQLRLAKGLPPIKLDYVPSTWSWQEVRLELRHRARCPVNFIFEGKMVHDEGSWAWCVETLRADWKSAKELLGELAVDLIPILCSQCQQKAPESFPPVGTPWRAGCGGQEWCPLARWQLRQMLRSLDDSTDLKIEYKEFAAVFEKLWPLTQEQTDEAAASARVAMSGCLFASNLKVKARQSWDAKWAWLTESSLAYAAAIAEHGKPQPRAQINLHPGVSVDKESDSTRFRVRSKPAGKGPEIVFEFECASKVLQERWCQAIQQAVTRPPEPVVAPAAREQQVPPPKAAAVPAELVQPTPAPAPTTPTTPTTPITPAPQVPARMNTKRTKQAAPRKKVEEGVANQVAAGELPERCLRVAGPYRSMCGAVHLLHRCFFEALNRNPISLCSQHGIIAVRENRDRSCSAVLRLEGGGGGVTLCHRIARYCVYMAQAALSDGERGEAARARQEEGGDAAKYVNLQSGQEFLLTRHGKPFHCKIRRPGTGRPEDGAGDARAASLDAIKKEAGGGTGRLDSPLELRVSGLSRPLVLGLLTDGAKFAGHADAVSPKSKAVEAQRLISFARECVRVPRAAPSAPNAAGPDVGISLLEWNAQGKAFLEPVQTAALNKELSLMQLILEWEAVARGESKKQLSQTAQQRLADGTNLQLEQKGLTLKERMALKQYLQDLKGVEQVVADLNSTALLCPLFVRLGAWQDLVCALHRILDQSRRILGESVSGDGEAANFEEQAAEGATQRKIKIDIVLCTGKNAILKSKDFKLAEIASDCERLVTRARALLGSEIRLDEGNGNGEGGGEPPAAKPSADSWLGRNAAALAALSKAATSEGFPRCGLAAGAIPVVSSREMRKVDLQLEVSDPLQINELTLHVLALRLPEHVRFVYLTVDFYSLPRVRSGPLRLSVAKSDGLRSVSPAREYLAPLVPNSVNAGVGNSLRMTVTPEMAGSIQPADFAHYVCSHDLDIDVWDAESCLALGTLRIGGLERVLRQGRSAVQMLASPPFVPAAPSDGAIPSSTSGKDPHVEVATAVRADGTLQPGAVIRILNRGLVQAGEPAVAASVVGPAAGGFAAQQAAQLLVKSWRTDKAPALPPLEDRGGGGEVKSGMAAILHARKYKLAKDKGRIPAGNLVPIDTRAAAVAQEHATALKTFRSNPAYQLQGIRDMIQKLSVVDVEMCPVFGQTNFEYEHRISNPHDHVVVCMAAITHMDVDRVALEMRQSVMDGLQISGGVLQPAKGNEEVLPHAQTWLLQPQAEVVMSIRLDNRPEHWQLEHFVATVQVVLMRQAQVSSQYNLRVTVRPLPVVLDRHLRFFVNAAQGNPPLVKRLVRVDSPALAYKSFKPEDELIVRTVPEAGIESKLVPSPSAVDGPTAAPRAHRVCQLSVKLGEVMPANSALARLPGWERQTIWNLFVLLCDKAGQIVERWKVELVAVDAALPDSRNKSVQIVLPDPLQNKLFGFQRQFYSSDWERLPCYRKRDAAEALAAMERQEPSPKFAIGRGFSKVAYVVLVRQENKKVLDGNPHGVFHADAELFCDDARSVVMARIVGSLEKALAELRKAGSPVCSPAQWTLVKESGVLAFRDAAVHVERNAPAQEDLVKAERAMRLVLRGYRDIQRKVLDVLPEACRDPCFFERPRDAFFSKPVVPEAKANASKPGSKVTEAGTTNGAQGMEPPHLVAELTVWHSLVVAAWCVRPAGGAAGQDDDEEDGEGEVADLDDGAARKRRGPKPIIRFESVFHLWVPEKAASPGDALARSKQAEALERHVYKGDHSCPVEKYFSIYERNQELIRRYPELTKDDLPVGPFHETAMAEARIFILAGAQGEGSAGYPTRDEVLQAVTDVAWSFEWCTSGQYLFKPQGLGISAKAPVSVSPAVADLVKIAKDAGGVLHPADLHCRARKRVMASFCKVLSWGAVGGRVQPYHGKGVDLEEVHELRSAAEAKGARDGLGGMQDGQYIEAERTDEEQPEPLECVVLTGVPLHLDMLHLEFKDFLLDSKSGARRRPLSSAVRFPHLYRDSCVKDETGAHCLPSYREAKSIKALGFVATRPSGIKIKGRRVRIFSEDLRRHGWNSCVVLDYSKGVDGTWKHKVQFDDGKIEELMLDSMAPSVMELVPDIKNPEEDVLINTKALAACLVEDLHLLLTSFASMVETFNRKSDRVPRLKGFLKATSLPYMLRFAPGARAAMAPIVEPLLQRALETVLLEDSGGFCKQIGAIELPAAWKPSFPHEFGTMHTVPGNPIQELLSLDADGKPVPVDHVIEICFGQVQDILVVSPHDLWSASGMRLPGILVFSEGLAMPCTANHAGWGAEDCVESFVGEHTDVRLMQNYWFNHNLLDATRVTPVPQPLATRIELALEDLREASSLFRLIDADRSKTLETRECQSYLAEIGYLDEEIDNFFALCDQDGDGSITWSEFLLGAAALYKPRAKADARQQLGAVATALEVKPQGSTSPLQVDIDSGMSWSDVNARTLRVMYGDDGQARASAPASTVAGQIFFEYTNLEVARALFEQAAKMFDQIDIDRSGALERKELLARLRQPRAEGGYGYQEYQVDDFFREADADGNGSVDKDEFVMAAVRLLLTDKAPDSQEGVADPDRHWLTGLRYQKENLRLRCRNDKEWLAMRARIFPTRAQRVREVAELRKRLKMPLEDDPREADVQTIKLDKHKVHNRLKSLRNELDAVRKQAEAAQVAVEQAKTDAKDETKMQALQQSLQEHTEKSKKIESLVAELEPELKKLEGSLAEARAQIAELEASRCNLFLTEQQRVLKGLDEATLKAVCNRSTDGKCRHETHAGSDDVLRQVASDLRDFLTRELRDKTADLQQLERDEGPGADVSVMLSRKYHLRCLLHSGIKLATEVSSEWKETSDKKSEEVSWTSVYSGERRLEKPAPLPVLLKESKGSAGKTTTAFCRNFKDWKRTGVVLPVTDTTTWSEMRRLLPQLLNERFQLVTSRWQAVKTQEEWEDMKATLLKFSMLHARLIVAREVPPKKRALLPCGWEQHNILPEGWVSTYDTQASKFKFVNSNDDKAEPRWDFPLDSLDPITWPDDSVSTGRQLQEQLGAPPASAAEDPSIILVNWSAQLVAWVAPKATSDVCAVRVRVPPGKDGKSPVTLAQLKDAFDIKDDFVPMCLMESAPTGSAKAVQRKEQGVFQLPFAVEEGGKLGGFLVKPKLEWKEMLSLLKDKIEPKGRDRIFKYAKDGGAEDLSRVSSQREWEECVQSLMLQLRVQLLAKAAGTGTNSLRVGIFPLDNHAVFKLQVLDALPRDESNVLPVEGSVLIDATPHEIRATLTVKQNTAFDALASELKDLCRAPCVLRYEKPELVADDAGWLSALEQIYPPKASGDARRRAVHIGKKAAGKRLAELTLALDDPAVDIIADEGSDWLKILAELRGVCGGGVGGLAYGGTDVREEKAYLQMIRDELKEKFAATNIKLVDGKVLNALRVVWKEDPKQGGIAAELERRRKEEDRADANTDDKSSGDMVLKLKIACGVLRDVGGGVSLLQGSLELGLRRFGVTCRPAKPEELETIAHLSPDLQTRKGAKGGKGGVKADPKGAGELGARNAEDVVIEVMRRTRKGKQKIKGLVLLQAGGERIFALSPGDLGGPGKGLKSSVSCCTRAALQGAACCKGLAWDTRHSVLHSSITLSQASNVFCYNGPGLVKVQPGSYTLPGLKAALWHAVLASGVVARDALPDGNPFDFGLTLDKSILAEGWEAVTSFDPSEAPSASPSASVYRHAKSGKQSDPADGEPVRLVCSGRGNFVALNRHPQSLLIAACVYWKGKGTVEVPSDGNNSMCFSGPRRLALAPGAYDLSGLQRSIQELVEEQKHAEADVDQATARPVFCFSASNHPTAKDALPPGWVSRTYDPLVAVVANEPRPPPEGMQAGRQYYIHLATQHAQWDKPYHRILLEITRDGYQANLAASSLRGVLGFDACLCPPVLSDAGAPRDGGKAGTVRTAGAVGVVGVGGKGAYMAQSAPRITWAGLKEVLAMAMSGLVRVDMEYVPVEPGEPEGGERPPARVATDDAWQAMLEHLRAKSLGAESDEQTEIDVDLLLSKSGDSRLGSKR